MVSPFEAVARKLGELGVYDFLLPWIITSAIIWGLLEKSKLFGEGSVAINSVLSISISFFIWGFLIFTGSNEVGSMLSKFFTQISFVAVGFAAILLVGSLFYPDFPAALEDRIPKESMFWIVIVIGLAIAISVGLINVGRTIYQFLSISGSIPGGDASLLMVAVIVLALLLLIVNAF
ncbi:MAG: hypothetical protein GF368_04025 [Candidatus Aenigmarchaeota archaeon]|nr:hypothetical protein [Candidatus Aenigmarchaeota archaeon]